MKPKFQIGEVVIRQAPRCSFPEHNGEYTVLGIITGKQFREIYSDVIWINTKDDELYYQLSGLAIEYRENSYTEHSSEEYLKKKHLPSSESFDKMMSSKWIQGECKIYE